MSEDPTHFEKWLGELINILGKDDIPSRALAQEDYWAARTPQQAALNQTDFKTKQLSCLTPVQKWDMRFLQLAKLVASWSKDPSTKCGAVIVEPDTHKVYGLGYNGFPSAMPDRKEDYDNREVKYSRVIHAENECAMERGIKRFLAVHYILGLLCPAIVVQYM